MNESQALVVRESDAEIIPHQPLPPPSLFGTADPVEVVARASRVAASLKEVIKAQGLISKISGKEYPRCEAWTLLGTMLGVFPVLVWTREMEGGWEARVEARTRDGAVVGAAEAQCLKTERNWGNRDDFALRSMAQTRATAKALRMPLGFVMTLGGFQATPAEEMDFEKGHANVEAGERSVQSKGKQSEIQGKSGKPPPNPDAPATEEQRIRWIKQLQPIRDKAEAYGYAEGILLPPSDNDPGEPLECWPMNHTPSTKWAAERLFARIQAHGSPTSGTPQKPPISQSEAKSGQSEQPSDSGEDYHNQWFYVLPLHFGKNAGKALGSLPKNYIYGLWKNQTVETEYRGKSRQKDDIEKDRKLRAALDHLGVIYQFDQPAPNAGQSDEPEQEEEVPF